MLLLLLAVPPTAFTTTDVYNVTADDAAGHEQSCPPHQICHNLSYYISQPDSYFTSDTTIIFLEGEHSFDREDPVLNISNVHNLTLKGQGQWPVAGAEETVMQSTVIINCTKGRGGFHFYNSYNITVEGLTVVNCGGLNSAVFNFSTVQILFFHKNSIQHMTGYGLFVVNSDNVIITNCSYYHSIVCNIGDSSFDSSGGAVGIGYDTQYSNTGYTLKLSHSNMTKCCYDYIEGGGGLFLATNQEFVKANVLFNHLKLSHNKAILFGGGLAAFLQGNGDVTLVISNCVLFNGSTDAGGGLWLYVAIQSAVITIESTDFVDNHSSDIYISYMLDTLVSPAADITFFMLNSNVQSEQQSSTDVGVFVNYEGCCASVQLTNTSMRFANKPMGFKLLGDNVYNARIQIDSCQFIGSYAVTFIVYLEQVYAKITNSIFSNNTSDANGGSVIILHNNDISTVHSCIISDNKMTGITLIGTIAGFSGYNVIKNNRNTEGAGITLYSTHSILVQGELLLYNNSADKHGGAILVKQPSIQAQRNQFLECTLEFNEPSSSVTFSGNRAGKGGSDMYGAILMGCDNFDENEPHVGQPNETSWYFDTPLMKQLHFSNTDRLSSMSSDPIMICFCNTTSNLPETALIGPITCKHIQD